MNALAGILTLLAAYLVGAIPFGFLIARARGVNIFEHGSGNIGATNVGRILGRRFGLLVFVLDFAKGAGPVALAMLLKPHFDDALWTRGYVEVAAGMAAFLGHLFPVYLKFRGGKGVAAGLGAVSLLLPGPTLAGLFVWFILVCATRTMSLASMAAVLVLCVVHLRQPAAWDWLEPRTWFSVVAGSLVIVKHHANIGRIFQGTENQIRDTIVMHQLSKSLHVLAVGMWFGMSVFFTVVVAPSVFRAFETLGKSEKRETWFPSVGDFAAVSEDVDGPKEQGTRAAGFAVAPMLTWYFILQGLCGFVALATAFPLLKLPASVHRWRVNLLIAAVFFLLIGWPIERKVNELRVPRNETTVEYLLDIGNETKRDAMKEARADFFVWHTGSLLLNFATILCVTGATALAGNLESGARKDAKTPEEKPPQPAT